MFIINDCAILAVDVRNNEVDSRTCCNQVSDFLSTQHRIQSTRQRETHRTHLHTIRTLVALRVEINTTLAAGSLNREVPLSLWNLDDRLLLNVEVSLGNVVDELLNDVKTLIKLLDVAVVAIH